MRPHRPAKTFVWSFGHAFAVADSQPAMLPYPPPMTIPQSSPRAAGRLFIGTLVTPPPALTLIAPTYVADAGTGRRRQRQRFLLFVWGYGLPIRGRCSTHQADKSQIIARRKPTNRNWRTCESWRRCAEPRVKPAPIELARGHLAFTLYLPTGSEPGQYEVEVAEQLDQPLATATGSATLQNGIAVLEVKLNLTGLHPGLYLLAVRQAGGSWNPYTVVLK